MCVLYNGCHGAWTFRLLILRQNPGLGWCLQWWGFFWSVCKSIIIVTLPDQLSPYCSYPLFWVILTQLMKVPIFFIFLGPFICRTFATANNLVRVIQTLRCTCLLTSWSGDQAVKTTNKSWHRTLFVFSLILISYSSRPLYAADRKSQPNII